MRLASAVVALSVVACAPETQSYSYAYSAPPQEAPLTGGTLLLVRDGTIAAVSDPDRDLVQLVDLPALALRSEVTLPKGSAPTRLARGPAETMYVTLSRAGAVARIDPGRGKLLAVHPVCAEPRGLSWDDENALLRVACAEGVLASLSVDGAVTTERWRSDLRDVWVMPDGRLEAMTFRRAERLSEGGRTASAMPRTSVVTWDGREVVFAPTVAWRSVLALDGTVVVAHQRAVEGPIEALRVPVGTPSSLDYYAGPPLPCPTPVVRSAVTLTAPDGTMRSVELPGALPVDVALSPDRLVVAVALAGSHSVVLKSLPEGPVVVGQQCSDTFVPTVSVKGDPSGVAFLPSGELLVHSLHPSRLTSVGRSVVLDLQKELPERAGPALFHGAATGIACASCHPEGRDDGHVWNVNGELRRTPPLTGGLLATAPFHWRGEHASMKTLIEDTFVKRMGNERPSDQTIEHLSTWLDRLSAPAPVSTLGAEELAQGRALFESAELSCTSCHSGDKLTNNRNANVGTGGAFQTPSLRGVGNRGPWLHDGRAATLVERFSPMGGGDRHGHTSQLTTRQVELLAGYLESL